MLVKFSKRSLRDIAAIQRYIAQDSPHAAARMVLSLVGACNGLTTFPERGRRGIKSGTRELTTVRPFIIVYRVRPDGVIDIDSISHGACNRR